MNNTPPRDVAVFTEAIRLPAIERAGYLASACADDPELRRKVEALLEAHDGVGDFLEEPLPGAGPGDRVEEPGEKPGDRIGRYRLLQQIGEGGCGVVYMAEQEAPVRRRVALKIIKPGMDTKSVIARFEAERQALALMDHPGIAKVFDAGATESGRPYFVMELIRGTKITEYCDQNALSTKDRLQLFVQVCHAVQHAHQKGIIHRDLKPSNILVTTTPECEALPVVIDFGIAKATTNQRLTDKTLFTAFEMLIGTPAYMSPEQTALTSADVDTRTDIYSLGVLLYELLTGSTPFDAGELLKAGLDEVRKVIREQEPPRPSARLSKLTASDLTSVAQRRHAEPPALIRSVRGDLDWIVMHALEKDRSRRYETANGFALDVQRYLADEVISARPPSQFNRLRKMVARNRTVFGAAVVFVVLLATSLIFVSVLLAREHQSRREAESARRQAEADKATALSESAKSEQVTQFLRETLRGAGPAAARGRDTTMLREILDNASKRVSQDLANQPASRAHILIIIGTIYFSMGANSQAEACLRDALVICRERAAVDGALLAQNLVELVRVLNGQRKVAEAIPLANETVALRRKLFGNESAEVATALFLLSSAYTAGNEFEKAEPYARESVAILRRRGDTKSFELSETLLGLARALAGTGQYAEALAPARESYAIREQIFGSDHPGTARSLQVLAYLFGKNRLWAEAEPAFDTTIRVLRKVEGVQSSSLFYSLLLRAEMLRDAARYPEAEAAFREVREITANQKAQRTFLLRSLTGLGDAVRAQGRYAEAESALREALRLAREMHPPGYPTIAEACDRLAGNLLDEGKVDEAENLLSEMLPPAFKAKSESASLLEAQAFFYARRSRWVEGAKTVALALDYQPTNTQFFEYLTLLLAEAGDVDAYRAACARAVKSTGTTDVAAAARVLRACLMYPPAAADFAVLTPLGALVATSQSIQGSKRLQAGKALFEYRQEHFSAAVEWAEKTLQTPCPDFTQAEAYPILAMAWVRLGQAEKARAAMEQVVRLQSSHARVPTTEGTGAPDWREWIVGDILMREAAALAGPKIQNAGEARHP